MPNPNPVSPTASNYDPRWFIWTIVFLVATGVSLVSYIVFSENDSDNFAPPVKHKSIIFKNTKPITKYK